MKNNIRIFWGAILVALGFLLLGIVNDWFQFEVSIREISKYWPMLIILAGVAVLFNPKKTVFNPTTALLLAFAIPLAIYNTSATAIDHVKYNIEENLNFDFEEDADFTFNDDSSKKENFSQNFNVPFDRSVEEVDLEIGGGAAEFFLSEPESGNLFEANTKLYGNKFDLEEEKIGKKQEIKFKMNSKNKNSNTRIGKGISNDVYLKLSKTPIWNLDMGIGAGELKFDLSTYKIKNISLKTGAADISLKMGDKIKEAKVRVESGVAKIKIEVPKGVACQINMVGALNAKDFDGFTKSESGTWKTDNFDSVDKKIFIDLESGLSAVIVNRY